MLVVRRAQLEEFARVLRRNFTAEATVWARDTFPTQCDELGDEALKARLEAGVNAAAGYGLRERQQVLRFLNYVFERGEGFDAQPWAAPILNDSKKDASLKLLLLEDAAREASHAE